MPPPPSQMEIAIFSQPAQIVRCVETDMDSILSFGERIAHGGRIYLVGTGSSYHAAEIGSWFFNRKKSKTVHEAVPLTAFRFVNYTPLLDRNDIVIVISHRGYKQYSSASVRKASELGCTVAAVTGKNSSIAEQDVDFLLRTVEQEKSSAHTVSMTASMSVLLAISLAALEKGNEDEIRSSISDISRQVQLALECGTHVRNMLSEMFGVERVWISGSGPNEAVAKEGALKIQETSYTDAYGFETEQLIHGPLRAANIESDLFLPVIWGKGKQRSRELVSALKAAGGRIVTISDSADDQYNCLQGNLSLEEIFSPFVTLVPLQLIALHLSAVKETDPDSFRGNDPRFRKVDEILKL